MTRYTATPQSVRIHDGPHSAVLQPRQVAQLMALYALHGATEALAEVSRAARDAGYPTPQIQLDKR